VERGGHSPDCVHIEHLEVFARVGVTEQERSKPQRLVLNISLFPRRPFNELSDDIGAAVNYSSVHARVHEFMETEVYKLIETFAEHLAARLLETFPVARVDIELRKFVLPGTEFVAVRVRRAAASE
jgi:dihydroneopterin aldolase